MDVLTVLIHALLFCNVIVNDSTASVIFPKAFKQHPRQSDFHFTDPKQAEFDSSKLNPKFPLIKNGLKSRLFEVGFKNKRIEEELQDFISHNDIDSSGPFPYKFLEGSGGNDQAVSQETQDYFNDGINERDDEYMDTSSEDATGIQDYYGYNYHGIDESYDDYVYTSSESPQEIENGWRYYSDFSGDCSDENEDLESDSNEINDEGSDDNRQNIKKSNNIHRVREKSGVNKDGHTETQNPVHDIDNISTTVPSKNIQNNSDGESRIFSENVESDKADFGNNLIYLIVGISCVLLFVVLPIVIVICWRRWQKRLNEERVYADRQHQIEEQHGLISTNARPIYVPRTRSTDHVADSANKTLQDECQENIV